MKKHILFLSFISYFIMVVGSTLVAQDSNFEMLKQYKEELDDPYKPRNKDEIVTSPAYKYRGSSVYTIQVNTDEDGDNILFDAANEPSIAIDPLNPDRMLIGWRQFYDVTSNFRQAGYAYTDDGGQTWTSPDPIDAGIFRSDPVLATDNDGIFYYNSLTKNDQSDYWCDVFRTSPDDFVWDDGVFAQGGDKQWMTIDKSGGIGDGNIYAFWNASYSICYPGSYTRSIDGGDNYEECDGIPGNPIWGLITVGPDGEMYTVGAASNASVVVTKSTSSQDPSTTTGWDNYTYVNLKGDLTGWQSINPAGLLGQAYIDVDRSNGVGRGNVYVLASVERYNGDPADVMFARSTNGGINWSDPVKVNDDPTTFRWQWFGTMSVAPNGRIDAVWLDTRFAPGTNMFLSELFYSYSIDYGNTWSTNEVISEQFNPHLGWPNQNKMGDYFHMESDNNGAHLAWANTINGEQDVYYTFINPWFVGVEDFKTNYDFSLISYPNPVQDQTTLRYTLDNDSEVTLTITDMIGNTFEVFVNQNQNAGTHNFIYNADNLSSGIYFCKLLTQHGSQTIKITVL